MYHKTEFQIFCKNVKQLRQNHRLSKTEMSKKLRIGIQTLTKIESGIIPPRLSSQIIFRIQEEFGIKPTNIFQPLKPQ